MASVQTFGAAKPYDIEPIAGPKDILAVQGQQAANQLRELQINEQLDQLGGKNALRAAYAPGNVDPATGHPNVNALSDLATRYPAVAQTVRNAVAQEEEKKAIAEYRLAQAKRSQVLDEETARKAKLAVLPHVMDARAGQISAYEQALAATGNPEQAKQAAVDYGVTQTDSLAKLGLLGNNRDDIVTDMRNFDPQQARLQLTSWKDYQRQQALQDKQDMRPPELKTVPIEGNDVTLEFDRTENTWKPKFTSPRAANAKLAMTSGLEEMDDATLDYAAEMYRKTGIMPPMGQGTSGAQNRQAILKRAASQSAAEGGSASTDVGGQKGVKADAASMTAVQKMYDAVESFTNTASANGRVLVDLSKKVDTTGVPVIERWIRAGKKAVGGDPDVTAFNAQLKLYGNEIAKIATNPNLTGVLTVEAQKEMGEILDKGSTPQQIERLVNLLDADAKRRKDAVNAQLKEIKQRISVKPGAKGEESAVTPKTIKWSDLP